MKIIIIAIIATIIQVKLSHFILIIIIVIIIIIIIITTIIIIIFIIIRAQPCPKSEVVLLEQLFF